MDFSNAFEEPARSLFFTNAKKTMSYAQMKKVMITEYDSAPRQETVHAILENTTLQQHMIDEDIENYATGLSSLRSKIEKMAPQGPPDFRTNNSKIRHLKKAALKVSWSATPISNIIALNYNFNMLKIALRTSVKSNLHLAESILHFPQNLHSKCES